MRLSPSQCLWSLTPFLLVVALFVGVTSTVPATAMPNSGGGPEELHIIYYSDDTYSEIVGERFSFCEGYVYKWGVATEHHEAFRELCW